MREGFDTSILFIIFNRPDTTQVVFDEIRKLKPRRLFVTADGPRMDKPGEKEKCDAARAIIEQVDWECDVQRNFSDVNLGCKKGVSSGISWFFDHVEEGIILEDDCVPDPSFFSFCAKLLERYRDDERVMMISGDNFQFGRKCGDASYYFSKYAHIWGWATWKRAWKLYDADMKTFPLFVSQGGMADIWDNRSVRFVWQKTLQNNFEGNIDTWDHQWNYAIWSQGGLSILPTVNLISNIGFGIDATHTKAVDKRVANMKRESINTIIHPIFVVQDKEADQLTFDQTFSGGLVRRAITYIRSYLYL